MDNLPPAAAQRCRRRTNGAVWPPHNAHVLMDMTEDAHRRRPMSRRPPGRRLEGPLRTPEACAHFSIRVNGR
ncbi:hypothetical protein Thpro_021584 [Acidihalobacter prosperus]|uniref:Uncharacterized protein n=1 Tax=Acidihalobacter prosperus TaxID=160660 RepID=A0A1A6C3W8_9GAMM|nr:hypothetical protein Thpro_021584 [Acidihalobacter prosperus]